MLKLMLLLLLPAVHLAGHLWCVRAAGPGRGAAGRSALPAGHRCGQDTVVSVLCLRRAARGVREVGTQIDPPPPPPHPPPGWLLTTE